MKSFLSSTLILLMVAQSGGFAWADSPTVKKDCENCGNKGSTGAAALGNVQSLAPQLGAITKTFEDGRSCKIQPSLPSCMKPAVACALGIASAAQNPLMVSKAFDGKMAQQCFPESAVPCMKQVFQGFKSYFFSDVEGTYDLLTMPFKAAWSGAKAAGRMAVSGNAVEQVAKAIDSGASKVSSAGKTVVSVGSALADTSVRVASRLGDLNKLPDTAAAHMAVASGMSDAALANIGRNVAGALPAFMASFFGGVGNFVNSTLMCEKWEGEPFSSACKERHPGYECASCKDKIASVCAIGGGLAAVGGMALVAGGVYGVSRGLANSSLAQKLALAERAAVFKEKAMEVKGVRIAAGIAGKAGAKAGEKASAAAEWASQSWPARKMRVTSLQNSNVAKAITESKELGLSAQEARLKAYAQVAKSTGKSAVTVKFSYTSVENVKKLAHALDKIDQFNFKLGMKAGDALGSTAGKAAGAMVNTDHVTSAAIRRTMAARRAANAGLLTTTAGDVKAFSNAYSGAHDAEILALADAKGVHAAVSPTSVRSGLEVQADGARGAGILDRANSSGAPVVVTDVNGRTHAMAEGSREPASVKVDNISCPK